MSMQRAVVIGGSIAGLCAARVLADYFDAVTVVDRDSYPAGTLERAGVPQSRHVHALLARGSRELERLFPGFERRMLAAGAHEVDFGRDFAALRGDGWAPREQSGITTLFASRTLLEATVRDLLRQVPRVELLERMSVTGLVADGDGRRRARGVRARPRAGGPEEVLPADLVVDASGRASKSTEWLRSLGLEPPAETVVDSFSGYATRWYQAPDPARWPREWWWKGIWIDPKEPDHMTAGVLFPVEDGRWIVTIAGISGHYPPSDEDDFTLALARLRSPLIARAVGLAEPISPVYCNRAMANRFRHYERWAERLDGFIAIGDSACAFNPVYGQGMTTAAVAAGILADCLDRVGPASTALPREFFRVQGRFLRDPWGLATGADFHFPATEGDRPPLLGLFGAYTDALFAAAADDAEIRRVLIEVFNMLEPPSRLFGLPTIGRVAMRSLWRRLQPGTAPAPAPALPAV
ncbi:MAG TPA: FAD-dependent monooxygenase [Candidatus Binatus sp.]|nr:FAD-dependent monooxygenase [Candidatus Binatus sp.]